MQEPLNPDTTTITPTILSRSPVAKATVRQVANEVDAEAPTDVGYNDTNLGHVDKRNKRSLYGVKNKQAKSEKMGAAGSDGWQLPSHRPRILEHPEPLAHDHRSKQHAWTGLCQRVQMDRQRSDKVFLQTWAERKGSNGKGSPHQRMGNWKNCGRRAASEFLRRRSQQRHRLRAGPLVS